MRANPLSLRRNSRQQNALRQAVIEPVETRIFCDGTFGSSVSLGTPIGLIVKLDHTDGGSNKHDFYKITTPLAGRLRVNLASMTGGDSDLYLYSGPSNGQQIGLSTNGGTGDELIDKSSVPAGTYYIEVRHSSGGTSNYTLGVQTDYAGSTTATARSVGSLSSTEKVLKDFVGNSDQNDYYKFTTSSSGVVTLKLDGLTKDADLQLLDSGGNILVISNISGTSPEYVFRNAAAGTFYARVYQFGTNTTNYQLHLSKTAIPADGVGNAIGSAKDLGVLGTKSTSNWIVNGADDDDYYKFTVAQPGNIVVKVTGLKADLDVELLNSGGSLLTHSVNGGRTDENITFNTTTGGVFYVHVIHGDAAHLTTSPYTLSITAPTDTAGNSIGSAKSLTLVGGAAAASGFVGDVDTEDWYKVSVTSGQLHGTLSGLSGDADLEVYNSSGTLLTFSRHGGTLNEQVDLTGLASGNYFFRVYRFSSSSTSYHLSVDA